MNYIKKIIMTMAVFYYGTIFCDIQKSIEWTWSYKKDFTATEILENTNRKQVLFCKNDIPLFSQLIFYWNAFRPEKGYFSFHAQVLDGKNKWHDWHTMINWGKDIQKSFSNEGTTGTKYCHVRLEMPPKRLAKGVRIKVVAHDGANLSSLRSLGINVANLSAFNEEFNHAINLLPSVVINGIPKQSQMVLDHPKADVMCSPTSCGMLMSYLKKQPLNTLDFALGVYDYGLNSYGSWPFNIAHAFEHCEGEVFFKVMRLPSFFELHSMLQKSIPVVVSVRGKLQGAPKEYNNGHLLLVIGWDKQKQKVICHDPAFDQNEKVYMEYDIKSFCTAWGRSRHLAYVAEPIF